MGENVATPSRWRVRDLCLTIALIAAVLAVVRMIVVFDLAGADPFDSRRNSAAPLRVLWLLVALVWLGFRSGSMTRSRRFYALAIILVVMQVMKALGGGIQPGYTVDVSARFDLMVWIMSAIFAMIAWVARAIEASDTGFRTQGRRDAPRR